MGPQNKHKIINDPVYGFITVRHELCFDLMDHRFMQRLRRISQLGLSHYVYPGAVHNRFHHAIGAMYLMQEALDVLREKGVEISAAEGEAACAAILLHDVGHGPFSHALEHSIVRGVNHEDISTLMMGRMNEAMGGRLDLAIRIFNDDYPRRFLHALVSSQLDMDRLDYLGRDSFYSGVAEGKVGSERIIKMLNVVNDQVVVEEKGIYSIEKFVVARRLMYWQVYLHRTVLAAEYMLMLVLRRAKLLASRGIPLFSTPALSIFLHDAYDQAQFLADPDILERFSELDDSDILCAMKAWQHHEDRVLSLLSRKIIHRDLFRIELRNEPFSSEEIEVCLAAAQSAWGLSPEESRFMVHADQISNQSYKSDGIPIRFKNGSIRDFAEASDHFSPELLNREVTKHFLCYPKELGERGGRS
jgi:HD superfamily phosphohydrolase